MKVLDLISKNKKSAVDYKPHVKLRFFQRVGYILTDEKYNQLLEAVRTTGRCISNKKEDSSLWSVDFEGVRLKVAYKPFEGKIITILT